MTQKIFSLLSKFDILSLVKIEDTYFKSMPLKKKIKLSKEVVLLNYSEFSPFRDFDTLYTLLNDHIGIWFTDKKIRTYIAIPESYVIANYLLKNEIDGIIIFDTYPQNLLVIKDRKLCRQISKDKISKYEINLLQKEFFVNEYHFYEKKEYEKLLVDAIENILIKDIFAFFNFNLNYKEIVDIFIKKLSTPISIFVALLFFIEGLNYLYVNKKISTIENKYKTIKEKTQITRDKIYVIEEKYLDFNTLDSELKKNQNLINILHSVSDIVKDKNASLLYFKVSENEFSIRVDTNKTSELFSNIVSTGYFNDLKIQSSVKNKMTKSEKVIIKGNVKW